MKSLKLLNSLITLTAAVLLAVIAFLWGLQTFVSGREAPRRATPLELKPLNWRLDEEVVEKLISPTPEATATPGPTVTPKTTGDLTPTSTATITPALTPLPTTSTELTPTPIPNLTPSPTPSPLPTITGQTTPSPTASPTV